MINLLKEQCNILHCSFNSLYSIINYINFNNSEISENLFDL